MVNLITNTDAIRITVAAQMLRVHRETVKRWIKSKKIAGKKIDGKFYVSRKTITNFIQHHANHDAG